jgi:hypothetical protein
MASAAPIASSASATTDLGASAAASIHLGKTPGLSPLAKDYLEIMHVLSQAGQRANAKIIAVISEPNPTIGDLAKPAASLAHAYVLVDGALLKLHASRLISAALRNQVRTNQSLLRSLLSISKLSMGNIPHWEVVVQREQHAVVTATNLVERELGVPVTGI